MDCIPMHVLTLKELRRDLDIVREHQDMGIPRGCRPERLEEPHRALFLRQAGAWNAVTQGKLPDLSRVVDPGWRPLEALEKLSQGGVEPVRQFDCEMGRRASPKVGGREGFEQPNQASRRAGGGVNQYVDADLVPCCTGSVNHLIAIRWGVVFCPNWPTC